MPKLYLLRHAEASGSLEVPDMERTLTSHGIDQAKRIGNHLITSGAKVDMALCSIAKRTQMTLLTIQVVGATFTKTQFVSKMYNASAGDLFSMIQESEDDNVLVVAHNPGIHELARSLVGGGDDKKMEALQTFFSPGTMAVIDCKVKKWKDLQPGKNYLEDLFNPD